MSVIVWRTTTEGVTPMSALIPVLIVMALMLAIDLAAIRIGADSRDRLGAFPDDRLR